LGNAEGFADQAVKLIEYGARAVNLIIGLATFQRTRENSSTGELREVPLYGAWAETDTADDLPLIETLVGMAKQQAQ
jgi:hypothetical protein